MTKQKLLLYLLLLMGMVQGAMAQEKEPYAVLSDNNTKLTFYYDTHKAERNGMSVGPFTHYDQVSWYDQRQSITTVVFDALFADCTSLTSTAYWFYNCDRLTTITSIENLKTENVTDMSDMFYYCSGLTSLDISGFNTNMVTDMSYMFYYCSGLTSLDVSGFNTNMVTYMSYMFYNCSGLTSLDVSGFKTDNVTDMSGMFIYCSGLTSLDLSGFNTANVTDMHAMFKGCKGLTSLDVSGFNTGKVTDMRRMFSACSNLTSLDLSSFFTMSVIRMDEMFSYCNNLQTIIVSNGWMTDNVWSGSGMFWDCTSILGGQGTGFNQDVMDISYAHIDGGEENPGYLTWSGENRPFAYRQFSNDGTLLTFYYDDKFSSSSLPLGPTQENTKLKTVIFDTSFADCTSFTSTACWFRDCSNLTTMNGIENLKTGNVTNMNSMFSGCYTLRNLDVSGFNTDNVTDMSYMFYNCYGLTSLDVSGFKTENVKDMSYMFCACSGLTSLDVSGFKTDNVSNMRYMFCACSGLTSLDVSGFNTKMVTNMDDMFSCCSSLTSLDVSSFNTKMVTNMDGMFYECLSLTTIYVDGTMWTTDNVISGSNMFYYCEKLVGGNGTVYSHEHTDHEYARVDFPGQPGYFTVKTIGTTITLTVTDDGGYDVTQDVSIVWYDADGKQIGTGSKLNGVGKNIEVYYSVLLEESMGRVYREVNMRKADAGEDGIVACQLEKIGRVTLEGRVSATDIDKTTATVSVRQMLNGKWQQDYTAQTDRQGLFSVEVYDDETDITVSGDGYLDATLHRDGFGGSGNVGTIPVSLLSGFAIAANVSMEQAVATGEAPQVTAWTDGLTNIDFKLTNLTKGTMLTDIAVQGGNVVIKSGASVGDEIKLAAVSKQGVFADAETTFTIAEGANSFDLQLTELGGIDATCTASNNSTTVGYLYDHDDQLAARGSYRGETLSLRHLKSGTYTLASMGQSLLLISMTSLADLNAVGLSEGTDYVTTRIDVADGELTAVSISDVPRLDETPFYYTTGNTYFKAGKASVTAGNYITLQAHVDLKPEHADKANGVTLTIDLPEGCQMVENSVIANRQAVPHTVSGNRVTMTLAKEQYESEVRFCVTPTLNQSYTVTAMATFDIDGQVQQPIGTALFEAKGLSLSTPKYAASTTVTINGTAKKHSEVNIYDNDVLVGTTTSKADGSWTAQCELYKPYSHSFHDIYAKITTEDGMELTSETKQVEYDKTGIVPSSVMMLYRSSHVEFDLLQGTTTPTYYSFVPGTGDFTFLADFTRNDSTVVKNVSIKVLNSDGTVRTLPATFDGNQGKWVATTKYSSTSRLPINVTVEYDLMPSEISDEEREEWLLDQASLLTNCSNSIKTYIYENASIELLEDDEKHLSFDCYLKGFDKPYRCVIENTDYSEVESMMEQQQFGYAEFEGSNIGFYIEYTENDIHVITADLDNRTSYIIRLYDVSSEISVSKKAPIPIDIFLKDILRNNLSKLKLSFHNGGAINGIGKAWEYLSLACGVFDYMSIGSDFDFMCNNLLRLMDKFDGLRLKTTNLITAKCRDGSYRLSEDKMEAFYNAVKATTDVEIAFEQQYYAQLFEYKVKIWGNILSFFASYFAGKGLEVLAGSKFLQGGRNQLSQFLNKYQCLGVDDKTSADILSSWSGILLDRVMGIDEIKGLTDFKGKRDEILSWSTKSQAEILVSYWKIQNGIKKSYKNCVEAPEDEETDDKSDFDDNGTRPIIDPSGYVYEAVLSNRLEGVTTTCYEQVNGSAVLWNAEDYSQQNPLRTDETGFYRWDVPQGMWQVKYEKEGYETAYSEWLPVPPPQLDVNIGMKQSTPPTVKQMRGYEEGITVEMAKYMRPETMTTANITVTRNGLPENGSIVALNTEQAPLGEETYVSKVRFVPETGFNGTDQVVVTVHKEVESYCGVQMTADHVETVKIEAEVKSIVADSAVTVAYQGERELRVMVLPKGAAAGKTLRVNSSSQMIASLSASEVVIGQDGLATLTVNGRLPGGAVLDFAIDGSDVTATTKVQVVMGRDMVATPTASIASGETVNSGTMLTLSSATPGATIYYTLDGSCPCDEATRIRYEAPIAITESVVVKAIAVKDGMDDSDVATFIYMLAGIRSAKLDAQVRIACHDRVLTVTGAEGGSCQIYDLNGRELSSRSNMGSEARFHLKGVDVCLVHIRQRNGQSTVYKIQAQ